MGYPASVLHSVVFLSNNVMWEIFVGRVGEDGGFVEKVWFLRIYIAQPSERQSPDQTGRGEVQNGGLQESSPRKRTLDKYVIPEVGFESGGSGEGAAFFGRSFDRTWFGRSRVDGYRAGRSQASRRVEVSATSGSLARGFFAGIPIPYPLPLCHYDLPLPRSLTRGGRTATAANLLEDYTGNWRLRWREGG